MKRTGRLSFASSSRTHSLSVRSSNLSAATIAVLNEISFEWKKQEPTSCTQPYTMTAGPTFPDVTSQRTPQDLFSRFFYKWSVGLHCDRDKLEYANFFV